MKSPKFGSRIVPPKNIDNYKKPGPLKPDKIDIAPATSAFIENLLRENNEPFNYAVSEFQQLVNSSAAGSVRNIGEYLQQAANLTYQKELGAVAFKLLATGGTLASVKAFLGISGAKLNKWLEDYPDFALAVELGKEAWASGMEQFALNNLTNIQFRERLWESMMKTHARQYYTETPEIVDSGTFQIQFNEINRVVREQTVGLEDAQSRVG